MPIKRQGKFPSGNIITKAKADPPKGTRFAARDVFRLVAAEHIARIEIVIAQEQITCKSFVIEIHLDALRNLI